MKMDSGFNLHLPDEVEISKSAYTFILAHLQASAQAQPAQQSGMLGYTVLG